MKSFLHELATRLLERHGNDMSDVRVVFNNRRSSLFLRNELTQIAGKTIFMPAIIGMDDLVCEKSRLTITQKEYLLFDLYETHRDIEKEDNRFATFDEFIAFGEMLLNDFSEIDLYHVDAKALFANIHDLKKIGEWDIEKGELTEFQRKYLKFYESLYDYYDAFRERLKAQGKAYGGMAYREAADNIDQAVDDDPHQYYFAGFNALSVCEQAIIETFIKRGKAQFIADGDAYYYNHEEQEAGAFLRKLSKKISTIGDYTDHFAEGDRNITLVSCPEELMQTKYAGELLRKTEFAKEKAEPTALVLADEELLVPMLNSLPQEAGAVNVTMGYPMTYTAIYGLIRKLFPLHEHVRDGKFYHKDISNILSDHCIVRLAEGRHSAISTTELLYKDNLIYPDKEAITSIAAKLGMKFEPIDFLFSLDATSPKPFVSMCRKLIAQMTEMDIFNGNIKESTGLVHVGMLLEHLEKITDQYSFAEGMGLETLERIFTRMAQRLRLPFYGEPIQGIQLLGMLETRNLDFSHLIILSANEGILPKGRSSNSLIPYNLQTHFHLPTYEEKDAVYANHFFRLLQRAKEVYILYSTQSDQMGKGEPSRFVTQLCDELIPTHPNIKLSKTVVHSKDISAKELTTKNIEKASIYGRIREVADKGFSPSALNTYRSCPLKYYYQNILGIHETNELDDCLDESNFGTIVHNIAYKIYLEAGEKPLNLTFLKEKSARAASYIEQEFAQFGTTFNQQGRSILYRNIAQKAVEHLINEDIKDTESGHCIKILHLEEELRQEITLPDGSKAFVSGRADRIDEKDERIRIVDYKTGKVETKELKVSQEDIDNGKISEKSFQVLAYAWLYAKSKGYGGKAIESGIYPVAATSSPFMPLRWDNSTEITEERLDSFGTLMGKTIGEILDVNIPFAAKPSEKNSCYHCVIKDVCRNSTK